MVAYWRQAGLSLGTRIGDSALVTSTVNISGLLGIKGPFVKLHPVLPDLCKGSERCTENRVQSKCREDCWEQHQNCESEKGIIYPRYSLKCYVSKVKMCEHVLQQIENDLTSWEERCVSRS